MENNKINHICPKCDKYIPNSIEKHINSCGKLKIKKPTHKGLTFDEFFGLEKSKEIRLKISKNSTGKASTDEKEKERRNKISKFAKERGFGGYVKNSGRGKKGWYNGYWCDSSWELAWVIYNLEHNINFKRNDEKFKYVFNEKIMNYLPDFKIK